MEFENIRQALEYLYELSQLDEMTIKTYEKQNCTGLIEERKATVKDMQEYMFDVTVNIADLLGLEEIYLEKGGNKMEVMLTEENSNELRAYVYQIVIEEIKRAREDAGIEKRVLNQTEIAKYFGVSTTTIREWETLGMPHTMMGERLKFYDKENCRVWLMSEHR